MQTSRLRPRFYRRRTRGRTFVATSTSASLVEVAEEEDQLHAFKVDTRDRFRECRAAPVPGVDFDAGGDSGDRTEGVRVLRPLSEAAVVEHLGLRVGRDGEVVYRNAAERRQP